MLLLDTRHIPPDQRIEAVDRTVVEALAPCAVLHDEVPDGTAVDTRIDSWRLGAATLVTAAGTGLRLRREPRHVHRAGPARVEVVTQSHGSSRFEQHGRRQTLGPGDLLLNDLTSPCEFAWHGPGAVQSVLISHATLGLPPETLRRGARRLHASPLHDLVRQHVAELFRDADRIAADRAGPAAGAATVDLLRALITSAADPGRSAPEPAAALTLEEVLDYVRGHLTDAALSPQRIASHQHISVRYLYRLCREAGISLEQWIILRRLEGARRTLASPAGRSRTVASVAREWGFADPSHFARRFRTAYGIAPRDWQRQS